MNQITIKNGSAKLLFLFIFLIIANNLTAQNIAKKLFENHNQFRESALTHRRFVHADILKLINSFKNESGFTVTKIGESVEGRSINQIKIGKGNTKVLLWSQMHGNEATATMAIFDILNFFADKKELLDFKNEILQNCTLYFVPMLNPDGAEKFIRRNALDIDLNRDAIRLQSPEAVLLKKLQNDLKPNFGYNLHDQSPHYAVGKTGKQTTMAFLATAYNETREINPIRKRSMQLIVQMNQVLQEYIPNQVARFSDEFEPRAFGDNIQKWGTTLILIESGGYKNDPEKQFIRKLNYLSILTSLNSIATKSYDKIDIDAYHSIPENNRELFDLLIKNATISVKGKNVKIDIGINLEEKPANSIKKFVVKSNIEDLGDLSVFHGIEELDATNLVIETKKPIKIGERADFVLKKGVEIAYTITNGQVKK
jgi:Zinc carboxypeptidase